MSRARCKALFAVAMLVAVQAVSAAPADDGCVDFKWDVSKERALFAGTPTALTSGKDARIGADRRTEPALQISTPGPGSGCLRCIAGQTSREQNVYGGLAVLKISTAGSYRISVDLPFWIDVVSNGTLVAARGFSRTARLPGAP